MTEYQRTIKEEVCLRGVGVHSGEKSQITLKPAPPDHGVSFTRIDLPGRPEVPAESRYISGSERGTSLSLKTARVMTVEHLLAALNGLAIDNLLVEMDAPEPPMDDGSSLVFVKLIKSAGIKTQSAARRHLSLTRPVYLRRTEGILIAFPDDRLRINCTISFSHPLLDCQYLSLVITPEVFEKEICPARTFGFLSDAVALMKRGLIKGSGIYNTVVIGPDAIISREGLRFPDEFVRHKILDLLGDLFLLGRPLKALVLAIKSGHTLNVEFVKKLKEVFHE